jgi:hypothetical protein
MSVTTSATGASEISETKLAQAIKALVPELTRKFPDADQAEVAALVAASAQSYADARITEFVPVLIGQEVERQLRGRSHRLAS